MTQPMPVLAILGGTGNEGSGLATRWARCGYRVIIGSRQEEKAQVTATGLNAALGIQTITGLENRAAAQMADICVLTVVYTAHQSAIESMKKALQGKILVDTTARVDFRDPKPPAPPSAARFAQEALGSGVRVVAAFQNVPAHLLKASPDKPLENDVFVCADDLNAAGIVIQLARGGGITAYYAGGLDNALVVEGLTAMLMSINKYYGVKTASVAITGISC